MDFFILCENGRQYRKFISIIYLPPDVIVGDTVATAAASVLRLFGMRWNVVYAFLSLPQQRGDKHKYNRQAIHKRNVWESSEADPCKERSGAQHGDNGSPPGLKERCAQSEEHYQMQGLSNPQL